MMLTSIVNNIKIGVKIIGCFGMIFAVVALITLCARQYVNDQDSKYRQYIGTIRESGELKAGLDKMEGCLYHYAAVPSARNNTLASINQAQNSIDQIVQTYKGRKLTPEEKKIITDLDTSWQEMQRGYKEIIEMADSGKNDEVTPLLADGSYFIKARNNSLAALRNLNDYNTSWNEAAIKANATGIGGWSVILWLLLVAEAILLIVMGLIITESITKPLKKGVLMMQDLVKGHLSHRLHFNRRDEIGELTSEMDKFADNLQRNVIFSMQQISEGNIDITPPIVDDKDEIGPALNKMINAIGAMSDEISKCCLAALEGDLSNRADVTPYRGKYQQIVQGFNNTLDAVMGPINEASGVLEKIAGKDMTARMMGEYKGDYAKIRAALNSAVENLEKALQQVAIGAEQVSSASVQVSTGGQSLSQGASEQASSLEEISSSLQEMLSMTKQNALNAMEAKGVTDQARSSADKGVESMNRMYSAINQIKKSSDATAKIVKTIDEIAFQTNLLALNAAVEAARAGDAGRGFAVVAEEVRNLAMRSAEAAKSTANLIEEAVKNSENGVHISAEVLKNFEEINERGNKVSQVVAEIAAASDQQDQGISQVNRAVEQLNHLTQQNAANAEESASAAEEMSSQSEEMRSMVAGFKLTDSSLFNHALRTGNQSRSLLQDMTTGKKGNKAISGLQPDPRKVIPLDDKDHDILTTF